MPIPENVADKLRKLVREDANAVHIFRVMSSKQRPRKTSDVYRIKLDLMKGGIQLDADELARFYERLEAAGVGKFLARRWPEHSAFTWRYTLMEVAEAALAGSSKSKPATTYETHSDAAAPKLAQGTRQGLGLALVLVPFRNEYLNVAVPADITGAEAADIGRALCSWVRARDR